MKSTIATRPPTTPPGADEYVTVMVPEPAGRFSFTLAYRLAAGLTAVLFAGLVVTVIGASTDWRVTPAVVALFGGLVAAVTATSEALLHGVYAYYQRRHMERGRERAIRELIEIVDRSAPRHASEATTASFEYRVLKPSMDIAFAVTTLVIMAPTLVLIGLLIVLESRGPVLTRERRLGRFGREFTIWRFRTTRHRGGASPPELTLVGRLLKQYALDELPLLLNVLEGHLSLVGPRPLRLESPTSMRDALSKVAPGIIGPWVFRASRSEDAWTQATQNYLERWSLLLDLRIVLRSLKVLFDPR